MIIFSEITGKEYDTTSECLLDEQKFKLKQEEEEKAKKAHKEEVDKAYEEAVAACERYFNLVGIDINQICDECNCNCKDKDEDDEENLVRMFTFKAEDGETIDEMFDRIIKLI